MQKIHMMGIGGSGMAGVASLTAKMGYKVTGCDLKNGGHDKNHLEGIDVLVVSPAVLYQSDSEPELLEAKKQNIAMTWQEFLGKHLLKNKKLIAIAGTHGKSTTTAMVAKIMIDEGLDPTVVLGAYVPEWEGSSRFGEGEYALVEADEFNNNFLNYHPEIAVITNIEFDHPDFFKSESDLKKSFEDFKNNLIGKKVLITENDTLNKKFNLKLFGEHNQKNANMAFLIGKKLGINDVKITKSLEEFEGIGRRMELIGKTKSGTIIYDDYAHHPTAIKTTLAGVREKYPDQKILAIIEPHGYKRTKALLPLYKNVFDSVDSVVIGPIYQARDEIDNSVTTKKIAEMSSHSDVEVFDSQDELIKNVKLKMNKYQIVVVMGAGNSNLWAKHLKN